MRYRAFDCVTSELTLCLGLRRFNQVHLLRVRVSGLPAAPQSSQKANGTATSSVSSSPAHSLVGTSSVAPSRRAPSRASSGHALDVAVPLEHPDHHLTDKLHALLNGQRFINGAKSSVAADSKHTDRSTSSRQPTVQTVDDILRNLELPVFSTDPRPSPNSDKGSSHPMVNKLELSLRSPIAAASSSSTGTQPISTSALGVDSGVHDEIVR